MTENSLNAEAKKYLVTQGILVVKTNDNFTIGLPDNYCLFKGFHTWLEFKLSQDGVPIPEMIRRKKVQLITLRDIRMQYGVALYGGWVKTGNHLHLEIYDPLEIDPRGILPDPKTPAMQAGGKGFELLTSICKGETAWHKNT